MFFSVSVLALDQDVELRKTFSSRSSDIFRSHFLAAMDRGETVTMWSDGGNSRLEQAYGFQNRWSRSNLLIV